MPGDKPRGLSSLDDLIARGPTAVTTVVGLVTFASCYFRSFVFPNIPLLPGGDQIGFYTAGSRIVAGELPYRDFFEILPVGTELVYATLIKLFGFCTWIPGIVMAVLVSAAAVLVTRAARHAMRGLATLLPALFLVGFLLIDESFNATHHWFCTVAVMAAMLALLEGVTTPRIALAGGLAGLATCFTQTTGTFVVAALAIYLLWHAKQTASSPQWRQAILLCTSAVAVFAAVNGYFIWQGGLGRWFFATVVFPVRYFTAPTLNNWRVLKYDFPSHPSFRRWLSYPFLFLSIPLVYLGFFLARKRRNPSESTEAWDKLVLIALTGAGMLMAVAPSPSFLRVASAALPTTILLAWFATRIGTKIVQNGVAALAVIALALTIAVPLEHQVRWRGILDLPGGRTAFSDRGLYDEYRWLQSQTRPGEYFFGMPTMYLPFQLRNPAPIWSFDTTDYTRPDQVSAALAAFQEHQVQMIIIRGPLDRTTSSPHDHTAAFREYLWSHYRRTATFANDDRVWQKNSALVQSGTP
jgi:hypothetical protein